MKELELLRALWKDRAKRSTELIVPSVSGSSADNALCSLHNDHWAYLVGYAFREALDIKYEKRMRDKKPYWTWTQGPIISFKNGDLIMSKTGETAVQVSYALPMGWDREIGEMYKGLVTHKLYSVKDNKFTVIGEKSVDQMQFLELLIYGEIKGL